MPDLIARSNAWLNGLVWGPPCSCCCWAPASCSPCVTGGVQFRYLGLPCARCWASSRRKSTGPGTVSPFQAVATALASTVGVGNIAGVATAIAIGGPGALFWLWVSGMLGMCTKFAEIVIALHYREPDATGVMRGGAMYTLKTPRPAVAGHHLRRCSSLAAFGIGNMVQANSVAESLRATSACSPADGLVLVVVPARRHPRRHPPHRRGRPRSSSRPWRSSTWAAV